MIWQVSTDFMMAYKQRLVDTDIHELYLHIPFCTQKCGYCDFASWPFKRTTSVPSEYAAALETQLNELKAANLCEHTKTLYIGGGTPSALPHELPGIIECACEACPALREKSCEVNPESACDDLLFHMLRQGINRVSCGVQSTNPDELKALGRTHTPERALERLMALKAMGFSVSCDLMCAIPLQTDDSWLKSLHDVINCKVDHVSIYPLTIEKSTPFWARYAHTHPKFNSEEVQAARMDIAHNVLESYGYMRYETSSYAHTHQQCRHNRGYWSAQTYLGLGPSAASMLTVHAYRCLKQVWKTLPDLPLDIVRVRITCTDSRASFIRNPRLSQRKASLEFLTLPQVLAEDLMLEARLTSGIEPELISYAEEVLGTQKLNATFDKLIDLGLMTYNHGYLKATHKGWLLGNYIFEELLDLAPMELKSVLVP